LFVFLAVKKPLIDLFPCSLEAPAMALAGDGANTDYLKEFYIHPSVHRETIPKKIPTR
jgi:hypothetical protein